MRQINAGDILDIAMAGTSATLLAKRWESVLLVNVDNETLSRLIANKEAMDALMKIEGFRSLNSDIETIIAKSEKVKKAKKEGTKDLTPKQKKELSDEEKEYKSKRKQIQEKLIKFATRIPVFMYLTDYRERCLKDVITQLEPGLFKKVTGLSVKDFELLVSLGVFNDSLMNDLESPRIQFENHYVHRLAVFDDELYSLFVEKFKGNDNYKRLYLVDSLKVYLTELLRKPGTADISKTMCNLKKLSAWIRDRNLNERDGVRKYTYKVSEKKLTELIEVMMTTYEINITEKGV